MKIFNRILGLIILSLIVLSCSVKQVGYDKLPETAKVFIASQFPNCTFKYILKDGGEYKIRLSDGTDVEFTRKGDWTSVDSKPMPVPETVLVLIPDGICDYVQSNYPSDAITKIDKDDNQVEVELNNGLDLIFSKNGKFLRIDD